MRKSTAILTTLALGAVLAIGSVSDSMARGGGGGGGGFGGGGFGGGDHWLGGVALAATIMDSAAASASAIMASPTVAWAIVGSAEAIAATTATVGGGGTVGVLTTTIPTTMGTIPRTTTLMSLPARPGTIRTIPRPGRILGMTDIVTIAWRDTGVQIRPPQTSWGRIRYRVRGREPADPIAMAPETLRNCEEKRDGPRGTLGLSGPVLQLAAVPASPVHLPAGAGSLRSSCLATRSPAPEGRTENGAKVVKS